MNKSIVGKEIRGGFKPLGEAAVILQVMTAVIILNLVCQVVEHPHFHQVL